MATKLHPVLLLVIWLVCKGGAHPHNDSCDPKDLNSHKPRNVLEATDWLTRYGYITTVKSWYQEAKAMFALEEAIAVFQELAHIEVTGELNDLTLEWMGKARCGCPDVIQRDGKMRLKRNAGGLKWQKHDLTYFVTRYTRDVPRGLVDRTLHEAFQVWADVTPLTFTRSATKDHVDIEIKFVHGVHGDNNPFDGEDGVLAHAFFPPSYPGNVIGGDTHFDEAEHWTVELDDDAPGRRLFCVAVHEFGHALGLDHSDQQGSIMWPWSQGCGNGTLDPSDIENIQRLYGQPGVTTEPPQSTKLSTQQPATKLTRTQTTKKNIPRWTKTTRRPTTKKRKPWWTRPTRRPTTKKWKPRWTRPTRRPTTKTKKPRWTKATRKPMTKKPEPPRTKATRKPITKETSTASTTTKTQVTTNITETAKRITTPSSTTRRKRVKPTRCTVCPTRTTQTTLASTLPTSTSHPNPVCRGDGKLDAVDVASDGHTYGFKGTQIFRFEVDRIHPDYPKPIYEVFSPGPRTVDAAVTYYYKTRWTRRIKYITYLFKDNLIWRYEYKRKNLLKLWEPKVFEIVRGYPKTISEDFGIRINRISAAFKLMKKNAFYITKGFLIWEVQIHKSGLKTKKRPKLITKDPALSYLPPLDSAALMTQGGFFFFSGDYYHQLLPLNRHRARWMWPRYTLNSWFNCNLDNAVVPFGLKDNSTRKDYVQEIRI